MGTGVKLVSVIVLAYNSADTIVRTLESIKVQTYPRIELIITDDRSQDDTLEVVSDWIKDNRGALCDIKLVTSEVNTGIPGSSNRALKKAAGAYIGFLAADDCMMPDAVQQYVDFCEKNTGVIPISRVRLFSDEECDFTAAQRYCNRCYEYARLDRKQQYRKLLVQNWIASPAAAFYPAAVMRRMKGFDEAYRWMEDYPLNLKLMHAGYSFGFIDKELVRYRISGGSITGSGQNMLKRTEAKLFFREKMWYMIQAGMGWEAVKQSRYWLKILMAGNGGK